MKTPEQIERAFKRLRLSMGNVSPTCSCPTCIHCRAMLAGMVAGISWAADEGLHDDQLAEILAKPLPQEVN